MRSFKPRILLRKQSSPSIARRIFYGVNGRLEPCLPLAATAFLYYFTSPEIPRIAGGLRLRLTSNDDPASFDSGEDLLLVDGRPWLCPLYALSQNHLLLDMALSTLDSERVYNNQLLYTIHDTFFVDFSSNWSTLIVITEQGVQRIRIHAIFVDRRILYGGIPFTGSALARFERSTLLDHKGTRTVVLRFLKIIRPVECVIPGYEGGFIGYPKEGELFRKTSYGPIGLTMPVWSINVDESKNATLKRGLQLLWDA